MLDQLSRVPPEWIVYGTVVCLFLLCAALFVVLIYASKPPGGHR